MENIISTISLNENHQQVPLVVKTENVIKTYSGSKEKVLNNFNMTIRKGEIFALLGASGCGKTTLLNCILGRRNIDSGDIWILGKKPNTKESGVPGKKVGYMPQDIALTLEFTIKEICYIFGWTNGMNKTEIKKRMEFLTNLLELPNSGRIIETLSGGEMRRVSFAVALLHEPELLILDEPTVGVDPVLRKKIWNYLEEITCSGNQTVLITTHYIEEAKKADTIGMMNNGKLLVQTNPTELLSDFNTNSLEKVFLQLCIEEVNDKNTKSESLEECTRIRSDISAVVRNNGELQRNIHQKIVEEKNSESMNSFRNFNFRRYYASTLRRLLRLKHSPSYIFTFLLIPVIDLATLCLSYGGTPRNLNYGVINYEYPTDPICQVADSCLFQNLSCRYLDALDKRMITLVPYYNETLAVEDSEDGLIRGFFIIPQNFSIVIGTKSISQREILGMKNAVVQIRMDFSNSFISTFVVKVVMETYELFLMKLTDVCGIDKNVARSPIDLTTFVNSSLSTEYRDFLVLGVLLLAVFFISVTAMTAALLVNKYEGIGDRLAVAGTTTFESVMSIITSQYILLIVVSVLKSFLVFFIFAVNYNGSYWNYGILLFLQGTAGMATGLLIFGLFSNFISAGTIVIGLASVSVILTGSFWPFESLRPVLQWAGYFLPNTLPIKSIQTMANKGFGILHQSVWPGFASSLAWIILPLLLFTFVASKRESSLL